MNEKDAEIAKLKALLEHEAGLNKRLTLECDLLKDGRDMQNARIRGLEDDLLDFDRYEEENAALREEVIRLQKQLESQSAKTDISHLPAKKSEMTPAQKEEHKLKTAWNAIGFHSETKSSKTSYSSRGRKIKPKRPPQRENEDGSAVNRRRFK